MSWQDKYSLWVVVKGRLTEAIYAGPEPWHRWDGCIRLGEYPSPDEALAAGKSIAAFNNTVFVDHTT